MTPYTTAIAAFQDPHGQPAGLGFLVADRTVCTCAHVVNVALGRRQDEPSVPESSPPVRFVCTPGGRRAMYATRLEEWVPPEGNLAGDFALLDLSGSHSLPSPPPIGSSLPRLGASLEVYGIPRFTNLLEYDSGRFAFVHVDTTTILENGLLQVSSPGNHGYQIMPGFSGGPAWDAERREVAAMVVGYDKALTRRLGFLLPGPTVLARCGLSAQ